MVTNSTYAVSTDFGAKGAEFENKMRYCGLPKPNKKHQYGQLNLWPKQSDLQRGCRPIGSYWCHRSRELLSLVGRMVVALMQLTGDLQFIVASLAQIGELCEDWSGARNRQRHKDTADTKTETH